MTIPSKAQIFNACNVLFGPEVDVSRDFLQYLQISGIKAAFREKAFETHPDRAKIIGADEAAMNERFKEVTLAYEMLKSVVQNGNEILKRYFWDRSANRNSTGTQCRGFAGREKRQKTPKGWTRAEKTRAETNERSNHEERFKNTGKRKTGKSDRTGYREDSGTYRKNTTGSFRWKKYEKERKNEFSGAGFDFETGFSDPFSNGYSKAYREKGNTWRRYSEFQYRDYSDHYYSGGMPARELMLGQFLYYSGIISWRTLINSILWQRRNRPLLGKIAQEWMLLSKDDIWEILKEKQIGEKFGECAVRMEFINQFHLRVLLWKQKQLQVPIGEYFIRNHVLAPEDLEKILLRQRSHNRNMSF